MSKKAPQKARAAVFDASLLLVQSSWPYPLSPAAACDGNFYSVSLAGNEGKALPGTVPLK